jgi:DNA replication protein DnaC
LGEVTFFDQFWSAYPKKKAKQDALKAWKKITPIPDQTFLDTILAALKAAKASEEWTKDGGKFIPYPATWLNGRRWEDEIPSSAGVPGLARTLAMVEPSKRKATI